MGKPVEQLSRQDISVTGDATVAVEAVSVDHDYYSSQQHSRRHTGTLGRLQERLELARTGQQIIPRKELLEELFGQGNTGSVYKRRLNNGLQVLRREGIVLNGYISDERRRDSQASPGDTSRRESYTQKARKYLQHAKEQKTRHTTREILAAVYGITSPTEKDYKRLSSLLIYLGKHGDDFKAQLIRRPRETAGRTRAAGRPPRNIPTRESLPATRQRQPTAEERQRARERMDEARIELARTYVHSIIARLEISDKPMKTLEHILQGLESDLHHHAPIQLKRFFEGERERARLLAIRVVREGIALVFDQQPEEAVSERDKHFQQKRSFLASKGITRAALLKIVA